MKAKRILPVMLLSLLLTGQAVAQQAIEMFCTSNKSYIDEAKTRTWVVELVPEDPQILKQIGKKNPKALNKYKTSIAAANEVMKKVVAENWALSEQKPEFKTREEIAQITKKGEGDNYVLLWMNRFQTAQSLANAESKSSKPKPIQEEAILSIRLVGNSYRHIGAVNMPSAQPTEAEMLIAFQLLQNHFQIREMSESATAFEEVIKDNATLLKEKTLLVPNTVIKKGITDDELKALYPYPIKVVDAKEIEEAVTSRSKEFCVVQVLPAYGGAKPVSMHLVVDAETGKVLARSVPPTATLARGAVKPVLKPENFKDFLEFTEN